jgi:hypothetical protein
MTELIVCAYLCFQFAENKYFDVNVAYNAKIIKDENSFLTSSIHYKCHL